MLPLFIDFYIYVFLHRLKDYKLLHDEAGVSRKCYEARNQTLKYQTFNRFTCMLNPWEEQYSFACAISSIKNCYFISEDFAILFQYQMLV